MLSEFVRIVGCWCVSGSVTFGDEVDVLRPDDLGVWGFLGCACESDCVFL